VRTYFGFLPPLFYTGQRLSFEAFPPGARCNQARSVGRYVSAGIAAGGSSTALVLPAVYAHRFDDALITYGPDLPDLFRRAASYVDRILRGEKPGELPVQAPTKYELIINLKASRALGLAVPASLLVAADEVLE
jgi:hypothetical protein